MTHHSLRFCLLISAILCSAFTVCLVPLSNECHAQQEPVKDIGTLAKRLNVDKLLPDNWQSNTTKEQKDQFVQAYLVFVEVPKILNPQAKDGLYALDDAVRRQSALRAMRHLAVRDPDGLGKFLTAVIISEAPGYFHRYSPYLDRVVFSATDLPGVQKRNPVPVQSGTVAESGQKLDPDAPLDNAQLMQNSDLALIVLMIDALKQLQVEKGGADMFHYLGTKNIDPRTERLVTNILADPDVNPDVERIVEFLNSHPDKAPSARYFFIQRIANPRGVKLKTMEAFVKQLKRKNEGPIQADILKKTLEALKALTSLANQEGQLPQIPPENYEFVHELAVLVQHERLGPAAQEACNETLASLLSIAKNSGDRDRSLQPFLDKLAPHVTNAQAIIVDSAANSFPLRTACIHFIGTCGPLFEWDFEKKLANEKKSGKKLKSTLDMKEALEALIIAFKDRDFNDEVKDNRINVAKAITAMGERGNEDVAKLVREATYDTIRTALFQCTPEESAVFLDTLSSMRPMVRKLNR